MQKKRPQQSGGTRPAASPNPFIGKEFQVQITRLAGLGEGEGRVGDQKLFVPCTQAGDEVNVRVTQHTKEFMRGVVTQVITPSPKRAEALCEWFMQCGGCTLQHLQDSDYQAFKQQMMEEAVLKAGYTPASFEPVHFLPAASRRRVEFKVQVVEGQARLGLLKLYSHTLVDVSSCPILNPLLAQAHAPLKAWVEHFKSADAIRAIRMSEIDGALDVVIDLRSAITIPAPMMKMLTTSIKAARISVKNPNGKYTVQGSIHKRMGKYSIAIEPDVFLQASVEGEAWLVKQVESAARAYVKPTGKIADFFSGIGTYSFPLSDVAPVHSYEMDKRMVQTVLSAKSNAIRAYTRDLFKDAPLPVDLSGFACVVVNPPREGAKALSLYLAQSTVPVVVMVSCNPATFARDAKQLREGGYRLESVRGLDQFLYSPYLEIVAVFTK